MNREEVLDRLRERPVAVFDVQAERAQLVLGLRERQATVEVDLERLRVDVACGDECVDARIDSDRAGGYAATPLQLGHRLVQELDIELEPERGHVPGLLRAEQFAGATDL